MIRFIRSLHIVPRWIVLVIDVVILTCSLLLAYLLRLNFDFDQFLSGTDLFLGVIAFLSCNLLAIFFTQSYAGIIRHTGIQDGYRIVYTTTLGIIFTLILNYIYRYQTAVSLIPLGVIIMGYLNSVVFLIAYRMIVKYIFSYYGKAVIVKSNVIIFGAGQSGQMTKQMIDSDGSFDIKAIAFVEDDSRKIGKVINGLRIYSARKDTSYLFKEFKIDELIIAAPNLSVKRKNEIVDLCLTHHVKVRYVPPIEKWIKGELSLNQIKDVNIEDLLGRESIKIDNVKINEELQGKSILITGAAGSIGSELVRQLIQYKPACLILFDQAETALYEIDSEINGYKESIRILPIIGDVGNLRRLEYVFSEFRPDLVFHAAAYKHVPLMEYNPSEAILCNVLGTKNVADTAVRYGVKNFVMISTDKAVNPTSVMGASKRIAEMYVQSLSNHLTPRDPMGTTFITTRFGNVLGSNGSVIPIFKKQIEKREPVTVTHAEVTRYFMTIPEACQLVLEAVVMGNGGEIYIFDMGKSVKILDLAKKMIQLSGLELNRDIEVKITGLRAGEKLYEELLNTQENTLPTHHPKIMIAKVREEKLEVIKEDISNLLRLASDKNDLELVHFMKTMVPEYISKFSKFQSLDTLEKVVADSPPSYKTSSSNQSV